MKYSYNWLRELSGTEKSPQELADILTMHSFEVEGIEKMGQGLEDIVIGKVLKVTQHPNADRLKVVKVEIGKEKILDIVCGAPNISEGQKVPVALVGAKLPNGLEIKEAEIRGEKSFGMVCAEDELGIGDSHEGIMVLSEKAEVGEKFSVFVGLDDYVLDIDILSNRGHDALSHVGVAREISALEGNEMDYDFNGLKLNEFEKKDFSLKIKNDKCRRYVGVLIRNITVADSPSWIKSKLIASGIRPINSIVDATNFVMLELGQPMHAFDFDKLSGAVNVKEAKEGEELVMLDGSVKKLSGNDLVIADSKKVLALAGIMGGDDSGVTEETKHIFLEAASFDATAVRRSRIYHKLKTDSSDRFEKGLDPNLAEKAMVRVIELVTNIAGGEIEGYSDLYPKKISEWAVDLDLDYVSSLLGIDIPRKEIVRILTALGVKIKGSGIRNFSFTGRSNLKMKVVIPTFRLDLRTQEDLIEEVGRIYGYEKIKELPLVAPVKSGTSDKVRILERKIKNILVGMGFSEMYNYSFYSEKDARFAQLERIKHTELENPMNPEQALMRVSLIPNILKNVKENLKRFKELKIFEVGRIYLEKGDILPEEKKILLGAVVLEERDNAEEFFSMKGYADNLLSHLGVQNYSYADFDSADSQTKSIWHGTRTALIKMKESGKSLGIIGEVNPVILAKFGIKKRVVLFEFEILNLLEVASSRPKYRSISKYPEVTRDISMAVSSDTKVDNILNSIYLTGGKLVLNVDLFDIYDNKEEGGTSFAFHIVFGSEERTLESKEVDSLVEKIISSLERELGIKIRK